MGKRKIARPIATRRPLHLVVRSSQAKGDKSFLHPRHVRFIEGLVGQLARENFIRVYRYANVGNHLHLNAVRLSSYLFPSGY